MIVIADYNSKFFVIENLKISQSLTTFNKCKNIFFQNGTQKGRITAADQLPVYQFTSYQLINFQRVGTINTKQSLPISLIRRFL